MTTPTPDTASKTLHTAIDAAISTLDDNIVQLQIDMAEARGKREALVAHRDLLNQVLPL